MRSEAGFTTIEIMIAITMMSVIALVVLDFFVDNLISYHRNESQVMLQANTRQAIDALSRTIRSAQGVEATNSITDANQTGGWSTDANTIVLATPSLDSSQNPIYADASHNTLYTDNIILYVDSDIIYRRVLANPNASGNAAITTCPPSAASPSCPADSRVVEDIATLTLAYDDPSPEQAQSVDITLTRIRNIFNRTYTSTVNGVVTLRNR